jgi:hypothetical protein
LLIGSTYAASSWCGGRSGGEADGPFCAELEKIEADAPRLNPFSKKSFLA